MNNTQPHEYAPATLDLSEVSEDLWDLVIATFTISHSTDIIVERRTGIPVPDIDASLMALGVDPDSVESGSREDKLDRAFARMDEERQPGGQRVRIDPKTRLVLTAPEPWLGHDRALIAAYKRLQEEDEAEIECGVAAFEDERREYFQDRVFAWSVDQGCAHDTATVALEEEDEEAAEAHRVYLTMAFNGNREERARDEIAEAHAA